MPQHEDLFDQKLIFDENAIADDDVEFARFCFIETNRGVEIQRNDRSETTLDEALALLRDALESGLTVLVRGAQ
ncbi:TPA: hypothetical protein ACGW3G_000922 [Stenotrophomonas maltophilia]